jgi:hypothetical protein
MKGRESTPHAKVTARPSREGDFTAGDTDDTDEDHSDPIDFPSVSSVPLSAKVAHFRGDFLPRISRISRMGNGFFLSVKSVKSVVELFGFRLCRAGPSVVNSSRKTAFLRDCSAKVARKKESLSCESGSSCPDSFSAAHGRAAKYAAYLLN